MAKKRNNFFGTKICHWLCIKCVNNYFLHDIKQKGGDTNDKSKSRKKSLTCNDFDHDNNDISFSLKEMFTTQTML
uniref:Putative ovule protein n=1 Tax=Solanum chacoense TaxID=4108 RepID=A0A0V0GPV0_SOLCH